MVECGGIKLLQLLQITLSLPIYTVNLGVFWVSLLKNCKRVVGGGDLALLVVGVDRPAPRLPPRHQPLQHHQGYRLLVTRPGASTSSPARLPLSPDKVVPTRGAYFDCRWRAKRARASAERRRSASLQLNAHCCAVCTHTTHPTFVHARGCPRSYPRNPTLRAKQLKTSIRTPVFSSPGQVGVQIEARVHLPNEGVTKGNRDAECAPYSSSELEVASGGAALH